MSLSNLTVKATYQGDGVNATFAIPADIIVDDSAEVKVYVRDESADPVTETLQTEGSLNNYQLTGAVLPGDFHTNVVFNAGSIPAATSKVIIIRILPLTQTLNLTAGNFNVGNINKAFDRVVAMIQQLDEKLSRAPLLSITEQEAQITLPDPEAETLLQWNAAGDDLQNTAFTGTDIEEAEANATAAAASAAAAALAETGAETAQAAAEAAQLAAEIAAASPWSLWVGHSVTDGQTATDLSGETFDFAIYSSGQYHFEIIRGTTVISSGFLAVQNLNGTGRVVEGLALGLEAHGVTFSVSQVGTVVQLRAALDSGAGDGTIKLSRRLISA